MPAWNWFSAAMRAVTITTGTIVPDALVARRRNRHGRGASGWRTPAARQTLSTPPYGDGRVAAKNEHCQEHCLLRVRQSELPGIWKANKRRNDPSLARYNAGMSLPKTSLASISTRPAVTVALWLQPE